MLQPIFDDNRNGKIEKEEFFAAVSAPELTPDSDEEEKDAKKTKAAEPKAAKPKAAEPKAAEPKAAAAKTTEVSK